ncbi:MAG: hypothetical protein ACI87E_001118, partial [Mariniblastus sp.]
FTDLSVAPMLDNENWNTKFALKVSFAESRFADSKIMSG